MIFKVGDIVQVRPDYLPRHKGHYKNWRIAILGVDAPWFKKVTYDILCIELGMTWISKPGEYGLTHNFHKIGEMTEEELKLARMMYL